MNGTRAKASTAALRQGETRGGWRAHLALLVICAAAVVLLHLPVLSLPYYWDELGYYVPAARDFYQSGDPLPKSTLSNPHPPLLSIYLAGAWKAFGMSPVVTRGAMAVLAGAALYALLLLGLALRLPGEATLWAAALTGLTPVFFAQSTLAHLDIPATLGSLLALVFFVRRQTAACALAATALCLARETGAVLVITLAALELLRGRRRGALLLLLALLPLAAWFVLLRGRTGLWLGDSYFAAYNLWNVLHPLRWLLQFVKRSYQLCVANFHWVATALIVIGARRGLFSDRPPTHPTGGLGSSAPALPTVSPGAYGRRVLLLVITIHAVFVSIIGGAALARYLLPVFPLFFLLAADAAFRLARFGPAGKTRRLLVLALPPALVVCWFWNPPYPFPYEENLAYADFVRLHREAARMLEEMPAGRVLTAWPAGDELRHPWAGYVAAPLPVVEASDFSEEALGRLSPDQFDVLLVFSRQWRAEWFDQFPRIKALQSRFSGFRPQVSETWIRDKFGLVLLNRTELRAQWVEIWGKRPIPGQPLPPSPKKIEGKSSIRTSVRDMQLAY